VPGPLHHRRQFALIIQLFCRDFGTPDDYIGTIFIPVSQLSGQGGNGMTTYFTFSVGFYGEEL
jgi:hypothetical protein